MKIIEAPYDEFNYYPCVNFYAKELGGDFAVVTFKGYECLFPNFKEIITIDMPTNIVSLSPDERQELINEKIKSTNLKVIKYKDCINSMHPNLHIYNFLFENYTKFILEKKTALFYPPEEDLEYVKNKLKNVTKPIVCINGRNLNKVHFRNNLFEKLIINLINSGVFVINCTINQPGFVIDKDCYLEPGDELLSYNRNLAYFKHSKLVVSVGDSGAISTHLMSNCDIMIFGLGEWVDNPKFGYQGESMLSARMKHLNSKTLYEITDYYKGLEKIKSVLL